MARTVVIILTIFAGWMVWWAVGQFSYQRGMENWIEARRTEGWVADISSLDTRGFPSRFDTTITEVNFADPDTGVAWQADFVQFLSLAYKPHQVIAVLPDTHRFSTPLQNLDVSHEDARASLFLEPSTRLGLDSARIVVDDLDVVSSLGWTVAMESGRFAAEKLDEGENTYRVGLDLQALRPTQALRALVDPVQLLPEAIDTMLLDATLAFDAPWDRFAVEDARPQLRGLDLANLSARWGDVTFRAAGALAVDAQGIPEGEISIRAAEWRTMLDLAVNAGVLPEGLRATVENGLGLMASLSGNPDTLDAPLTFRRGSMLLGPIPLGPAPRLLIR